MTAPMAGAPIGPDIPSSDRRIIYDRIPKLHELLPNGGWPGVVYAQICIHNIKAAADREERPARLRPIRGSTYYSISGPAGIADMALVGTGSPIQGAAPESGARLFFTDGEVEQLTGHTVEYPIWLRSQPKKEARDAVRKPSDEGNQAQEAQEEVRPAKSKFLVPKKNLRGHTHPANFGRRVDDCPRCIELAKEKT